MQRKGWGTTALTQRSDSNGWKFRQSASRWGDSEGASAGFSQILTHSVTWSIHKQPGWVASNGWSPSHVLEARSLWDAWHSMHSETDVSESQLHK